MLRRCCHVANASLEATGSQASVQVFSSCFEALWKRCGLENIFLLLWSSYNKRWAKPVQLGAVLQLFQEPAWGVAALCRCSVVSLAPPKRVEKVRVGEGGADGCRCPMRALATRGITAALRLPCSAQVARSRGAQGRLFTSPLLFLQPC